MLELPSVSSLTEEEKRKRVEFKSGDGPENYDTHLYGFPFAKIVEIVGSLPPLDSQGNLADENSPYFPLTNWECWLQGYKEWAIPERHEKNTSDDGLAIQAMERQIKLDSYQLSDLDNPTKQLMKFFAAPITREMKRFAKTDNTYASMADQVLVLKVELSSQHTSLKEDHNNMDQLNDPDAVKVWRLLTVFCDTTLDSFHDQILSPAVGWRRHYHAYQFQVPTNGAVFGPHHSDSIDMMHVQDGYMLDAAAYDLRHVLRQKGDRIGYVYDLGDWWRHVVTVLDVVVKGTTLSAVNDPDIPDFEPVQVTGNLLIAGQVNCPPEDGHGDYQCILKHGPSYQPTERGINWEEHGIRTAFDFDLKAHQKRPEDAVKHPKNPADGNLLYSHSPGESWSAGGDMFRMFPDGGGGAGSSSTPPPAPTHPTWATRGFLNSSSGQWGNDRRLKHGHVGGPGSVEVVGRNKLSKDRCAACGKQKGSNAALKLFNCGRCHQVAYCGVECQKADWKKHKKDCAKP